MTAAPQRAAVFISCCKKIVRTFAGTDDQLINIINPYY